MRSKINRRRCHLVARKNWYAEKLVFWTNGALEKQWAGKTARRKNSLRIRARASAVPKAKIKIRL
jgi:hypothetical protein